MTNLDHTILSTLIYYDLLDRPLTELEIFKYLAATADGVSFLSLKQALAGLVAAKRIEIKNGLYFLPGRANLIKLREKRLKSAQLKWKKFQKLTRWLALVPFLKLAAATGSLTAYNTRQDSDFDLLIVTQRGRLWITRTLVTALCGLLGARRHDQLTQDRICLNCFLTQDNLEIKPEAKPRDFHSAQEYGRLTPILEIEAGVFQQFIQANSWLRQYLKYYPWPNDPTAKRIEPAWPINNLRRGFERLLDGWVGERLEKRLGNWQRRRIKQKTKDEPTDQIYVSNQCLMFHPRSKSYQLMKDFRQKIMELAN